MPILRDSQSSKASSQAVSILSTGQTPSTGLRCPSIIDYAISLRKLSANELFFVSAEMAVSLSRKLRLCQAFLLQPPTLLSSAQIRPNSFESRRNSSFLFFFYPGRTRFMFAFVLGRYAVSTVSVVSTQTFWRALTAWWTSARRQRVPLQWRNQFWQSWEEGAGKWGSESEEGIPASPCVCVCV